MNGEICSAATGATPPPPRQRGEKTASEKLAEKLLLGWTMLGDTCPQCATVPLMRDKQRQLFCVACDMFLVREEDAEKASTDKAFSGCGQHQKHAEGDGMAAREGDDFFAAEMNGKVQYHLGGVVPLSSGIEENERLAALATASSCAPPPSAPGDGKQRRSRGAALKRENGRSGGTGGDSRATESSTEERSDSESSFANRKVSSPLLSWRENVRRRCWGAPPSVFCPSLPSSSDLSSSSSSHLKRSDGHTRKEEEKEKEETSAAVVRGREAEGLLSQHVAVRNAGRLRRDDAAPDTTYHQEEIAPVVDIVNGLRQSTLRKIQRYQLWLDVSEDNYDGTAVERDRQVFSALHAALQVLDVLHRVH